MNAVVENAIEHWKYLAPLVARPENEADFEQLVSYLDPLLDEVGEDENHPLIRLVDIVSDAVSAYEAEQVAEPIGEGIDALRYFMEAHGLHQTDLPEIGSQGVVSEILNGRRKLNLRQIKALAARFNVSPETFIT
ncbi:MAG: helix-turn-helix domain-containing protein [Candidatus Competibacteraceae bacterium]